MTLGHSTKPREDLPAGLRILLLSCMSFPVLMSARNIIRPWNVSRTKAGFLSPPILLSLFAALCIIASGFLNSSLLLATLAAIALLVAALYQVPGCALGILSPFPLFVIGSVLYIVPVSVTLSVSGVMTDEREVPNEALVRAVWIASAALLCAACAYLAATTAWPRRGIRRHPRVHQAGMGSSVIGLTLVVVGTSAAAYFVFDVAGLDTLRTVTYGGRYNLMAGHGLLLGCIPFAGVGGLVLYASALSRGRHAAAVAALILAGAVLTGWTYTIGSRSRLVQFLISVFVVRHFCGKPVRFWTFAGFGTILVAAVMLHGLLGRTFRLDAIEDWKGLPLFNLNPANTELGSAMGTLADVIRVVPAIEPYRLGLTYYQVPGVLIPRTLWAGRPQGAGEWYSHRFYSDYWESGGAFAFSPVAEAYLNYGFAGVVLVFAGIGIAFSLLERWIVRHCSISIWFSVAYAAGVPYILLSSRLDAATLVKSFGIIVLGTLSVLAVLDQLTRAVLQVPRGQPGRRPGFSQACGNSLPGGGRP